MFNKLILWVERYLFYPSSFFEYLLAFALLPLSFLYCVVVISKRIFAKAKKPPIPVISIGNLTVGGNGKTPFLIALAQEFEDIAIVLRGYKRESKGTILISQSGTILCDIKTSGDEAMLYAKMLPEACVIVSEDRLKGINLASQIGAKIVFLDDGFSKASIEKFDILLQAKPSPKLPFCLPSGAYREPPFFKKYANLVLEEEKDFFREVAIENPTPHMLLVTAISKPQRLEAYLPKNIVGKQYFPDHYSFQKEELQELMQRHSASSILTTTKDAVKMENFGLNLSLLSLHVKINQNVKDEINTFLSNFR